MKEGMKELEAKHRLINTKRILITSRLSQV
jgi:hypothetical protein